MTPKLIWSDRYGKNPKEGLHVWLEKNIDGYKRQNLQDWTVAFAVTTLGVNSHGVKYASENFEEFKKFVLNHTDCPYCKSTGKCEPFYNHYTGEIEIEKCPACKGSKKCEKDLASHFIEDECKEDLPF